jgi:serine/threonine protein kinase/Tfp pilus assembly protein PilF
MIGSTILHYKILERLGQGGMGVVYLAEDLKLERKVAIKFLPKQISENTEERQRFKIEAKAAAKLNHPNIATIHSIEEADNELFIVMEYIKGKELKEIVETYLPAGRQGRNASLQKDEVIKIATQIADGLEAAHKEGIIHRDIKSSNIMITDSGVVKVMDFGLAKVRGTSKLTKMGSTVGTIAYMSPEQSAGDEVDNRTDIWSFGVVLYEMLTGKLPFRGDYDQAIIYSILNEEPKPAEDIDKELQHIIDKSLKKNREDRYQVAAEIAEDLRKISHGGEEKRTKVNQSKLPWIVAGAAVIVIAIALYLFMPSSKSIKETQTETIKTIAILPFTNLSSDPNQGYFADGLSEELINVLSRNPKLRVTAKTSSFSFEGTKTDIKTIAAKLNVKNILEGSVQKAGNNLRISADLVNVETDATLWSNTYDGTLNNIFALQDSISGNVAEALNVALLKKEAAMPEQKMNPEAYNDFLLGNHFYNLHSKENWEKAESYYEKALSIDSTYAQAWVGLSTVHSRQAHQGYVPLDEGYSEARKEVEKGLELNANLADAYAQIGWIRTEYDWDWTGADEAYKKGLELEPGNTNVINGAAHLAATLGRFNEAIKLERRVIKIDPVNLGGYLNLGLYNRYAGSYDASINNFSKYLELNPQYPVGHTFLGLDYIEKDRPDSALVEIQKETDAFWKNYGLAIVYHALGKKKEADDKLTDLIKSDANDAAYQIVEIYAYRGENDKAFEWLERAYNQRDGGCSEIKGDPLMRNIVKDPRYAAFMKKMKLPL